MPTQKEYEAAIRGSRVLLAALTTIYGQNGVLHVEIDLINSLSPDGKLTIHKDDINNFITLAYTDSKHSS